MSESVGLVPEEFIVTNIARSLIIAMGLFIVGSAVMPLAASAQPHRRYHHRHHHHRPYNR